MIRIVLIVLVVVAILAVIIAFTGNRSQPEELRVPQTLSVEDEMEKAFNIDIPDDVEKAELEDKSGEDASGLATRKVVGALATITLLLDLPEPEAGITYEALLVKGVEGSDDYAQYQAGTLRLAKGGYILELETTDDLSGFDTIVVTKNGETVLEGSF